MPDTLRWESFSASNASVVSGFNCGTLAYCEAQSEWITSEKVFQSIRDRGTQVWLYFNEANSLVGFGSLGKTQRRYPTQQSEYLKFSIIPSLAIQRQFWGHPHDGRKYSHQIMSHLVMEAQKHGRELLVLDVHEQNTHAIALYIRLGFVNPPGQIHDRYLRMFMTLR